MRSSGENKGQPRSDIERVEEWETYIRLCEYFLLLQKRVFASLRSVYGSGGEVL
jgi:hypothetical protein